MPDYQKSKIYKLYSPSKNLTYIGSTTQLLCRRLADHLTRYRTYNNDNTKNYYSSYLVLDCEDFKIELLEEYACNNKQQLIKKEGEYIKNNECVNIRVAGRANKEWYKDNADIIKEKVKKYRTDNADMLKEKAKKYRLKNTEKIKEAQKQYRTDNADMLKEKAKQYYLKKKAI